MEVILGVIGGIIMMISGIVMIITAINIYNKIKKEKEIVKNNTEAFISGTNENNKTNNICINCGVELKNNANFCSNCGKNC